MTLALKKRGEIIITSSNLLIPSLRSVYNNAIDCSRTKNEGSYKLCQLQLQTRVLLQIIEYLSKNSVRPSENNLSLQGKQQYLQRSFFLFCNSLKYKQKPTSSSK